jgi:hypothetical protein
MKVNQADLICNTVFGRSDWRREMAGFGGRAFRFVTEWRESNCDVWYLNSITRSDDSFSSNWVKSFWTLCPDLLWFWIVRRFVQKHSDRLVIASFPFSGGCCFWNERRVDWKENYSETVSFLNIGSVRRYNRSPHLRNERNTGKESVHFKEPKFMSKSFNVFDCVNTRR